MNALEHNGYTDAWRAFGNSSPRPRAILVISAHWYANLSGRHRPDPAKDDSRLLRIPRRALRGGLPRPGDPALAEEIAEIVKPTWVGLDTTAGPDQRARASVLLHAFPKADIPVVQHPSTPTDRSSTTSSWVPSSRHCAGAACCHHRQRETVVHNLRRIDWNQPDGGSTGHTAFDDAAREHLTTSPAESSACRPRRFHDAGPHPGPFIPLLYIAGLAGAADSDR